MSSFSSRRLMGRVQVLSRGGDGRPPVRSFESDGSPDGSPDGRLSRRTYRRVFKGLFFMLVFSQLGGWGAMGRLVAESDFDKGVDEGVDRMEGQRNWYRKRDTPMRGILQVEEQSSTLSEKQEELVFLKDRRELQAEQTKNDNHGAEANSEPGDTLQQRGEGAQSEVANADDQVKKEAGEKQEPEGNLAKERNDRKENTAEDAQDEEENLTSEKTNSDFLFSEDGNQKQKRREDEAKSEAQQNDAKAEEGETQQQHFNFHDPPYLLRPTIKDWDEQRKTWLDANPHFKSESRSKPRVLIVTGSTPTPCKTDVGDFFHIRALKQKIDYASFHNYEIFYNFAHFDPLFDSFWVKIPTVRTIMLAHPEIDWFFWLDSDAILTDLLFEPPWESYEDYNMVMWGNEDGVLKGRSWVAYNAGVFLIRNCQWALDLMDTWSPYGPRTIRSEVGQFLTAQLAKRVEGMPGDDQSALAYIMIVHTDLKSKILLEEWKYQMSAYWKDVVDSYESLIDNYHPGLGDMRWPWITHFTGCSPCNGDYNPNFSFEKCMEGLDRAFHFADNQVLAYWGFQHVSLASPNVTRISNETGRPLERLDLNPWAERMAEVAAREGRSASS